ncbi:SDR family oxidoreductase [Dactylosporangium sp. NPDC048998]|uniref:SDR family oxidoreductase n=1 Tax=Dactylosporangium sp. NPDC048998 TaxID=3363976 RepID=UPI003723CF4D
MLGSRVLRADVHEDRAVLVTGGGTGLGRAIALEFAAGGAKVVVCGRRAEPLREVRMAVEAQGGSCLDIQADLRELEQITHVVDKAISEYGRIDFLVNNAGGQFMAPAEEISPNGWRAVHNIAVDAVWAMTKQVAVRSMIPNLSGVVFFMAFSPRRGIPNMVHATSARAAVENMAAGLALEWSRYGIRTICIAASSIATDGLEAAYPEHVRRTWEQGIPVGRMGQPNEVSELISFLASRGGGYVTGTTVVADGGVDAWGTGHPVPQAVGRQA